MFRQGLQRVFFNRCLLVLMAENIREKEFTRLWRCIYSLSFNAVCIETNCPGAHLRYGERVH